MKEHLPRTLDLPLAFSLAVLSFLLLLLAVRPLSAWAYAPSTPVTTVTKTYTVHLPLVLNDFSTIVFPDDPYFDDQWGFSAIEAPRAWAISRGSPTVLVAVVDTGIDLDHPDLVTKVRTDIDEDLVNGDGVADDDNGHGTHVAGIAAAVTDNGVGGAGLGWEVMLLPMKVLDSDGMGSGDALVTAITAAADKGARVINMSLGGEAPCPPAIQDAVDYAYARGVVLVAAAGNHDGISTPNAELFPANCRHVLGVAAIESDGDIASYSNYGGHVSVAAPGSDIYSTRMGGGYGYMSGTSMATPHVSGLAALVISRYPSYTPDQVASAILDNAKDIGPAGRDDYAGCGLIDAYRSLANGAHGTTPLCPEQTVGASTPETSAEAMDAPFVPGELLVALRPGVEATQVALRYRLPLEPVSPALGVWRMRAPVGEEAAFLSLLRADPAVRYAHPNYILTALP